jgi:hypothetical protein
MPWAFAKTEAHVDFENCRHLDRVRIFLTVSFAFESTGTFCGVPGELLPRWNGAKLTPKLMKAATT